MFGYDYVLKRERKDPPCKPPHWKEGCMFNVGGWYMWYEKLRWLVMGRGACAELKMSAQCGVEA